MFAVETRRISKRYGSRFGGSAVFALREFSIEIPQGDFVSIMGPSGAGKTTLLNLIALIDRPDAGSVYVNGADGAPLRGDTLVDFRRRNIGFVFQDSALLETLTLRENIALPLALGRAPSVDIAAKTASIAAALGISEALDKFPTEVSGGQKQRAAAARALITEPAILLADEPTGALDSRSSRELLERFSDLNARRGTAVLMATHDPFTASWARRVIFLRDGQFFAELRAAGNERKNLFDKIMEVQSVMEGSSR